VFYAKIESLLKFYQQKKNGYQKRGEWGESMDINIYKIKNENYLKPPTLPYPSH